MPAPPQPNRYDFIDQFRGLAIAFLILSVLVEPLAGKGLVPSLYTHGFLLYDRGKLTWNWMLLENQFYSWIDLGSSLFMVISGVCIAISFHAHEKDLGKRKTLLRMLLRYACFVLLQVLFDTLLGNVPLSYRRILMGQQGIFTRLGIGTIVGYVALRYLKQTTKRTWFAIAIVVVHGTLYLIPSLAPFHANPSPAELTSISWLGNGNFFDYYAIPFEALSFAALSILGSCFWDWLDFSNPFGSMRQFHVPAAVLFWLGCFFSSWIIPFQHADLVVSQTMLAAGMGYFMLILFFCLERVIHFKVPLLSAMGKNGLLMYMLSLVILVVYVQAGIYALILPEIAWLGMILVTGTFILLCGLAELLMKRNVMFHF